MESKKYEYNLMKEGSLLDLLKYHEFIDDEMVKKIKKLITLNQGKLNEFLESDYDNKLFRASLLYYLYHSAINSLMEIDGITNKNLTSQNSINDEDDTLLIRNFKMYCSSDIDKVCFYTLECTNNFIDRTKSYVKPYIKINFPRYVLDIEKRNERIKELKQTLYSNPERKIEKEMDYLINRSDELPENLKETNELASKLEQKLLEIYGIKVEEFTNPYTIYKRAISGTRDLYRSCMGVELEYIDEYVDDKMYKYPNDNVHKILVKEFPNDKRPSLIVEKETIYY